MARLLGKVFKSPTSHQETSIERLERHLRAALSAMQYATRSHIISSAFEVTGLQPINCERVLNQDTVIGVQDVATARRMRTGIKITIHGLFNVADIPGLRLQTAQERNAARKAHRKSGHTDTKRIFGYDGVVTSSGVTPNEGQACDTIHALGTAEIPLTSGIVANEELASESHPANRCNPTRKSMVASGKDDNKHREGRIRRTKTRRNSLSHHIAPGMDASNP